MNAKSKIVVLMALSLNGFISRPDGDEDFLSHDGWLIMLDYIKKYGNLVWGNTTYESVRAWNDETQRDVDSIKNLVVVSRKEQQDSGNVKYCHSPMEAIAYLQGKVAETILVSGGQELNSSFIESGLVDEIYLSYNPVIIPNGKNLFNETIGDVQLELVEHKIVGELLHVKYKIIRVENEK
jgi:dihydrofolate reductase